MVIHKYNSVECFKEQAERLRNQKIDCFNNPEMNLEIKQFVDWLAELSDRLYDKFTYRNEIQNQLLKDYPGQTFDRAAIDVISKLIEAGDQIPDEPSLVCQNCNKEFETTLQRWIQSKSGSKYICDSCKVKMDRNGFIYRCRQAGFIEGSWDKFRLKRWDTTKDESQKRLKEQAQSYIQFPYDSLWLFGKTGVGKTHFVSMIGVHLVYEGRKVRYMPFVDLLDKCVRTTNYQEWRSVPILIIDDFEDCTTFQRRERLDEMIDKILMKRYNEKQTTIITTNLASVDMENSKNDKIQKLWSRVKDESVYKRIIFPIKEDLRPHYGKGVRFV